MVKLTNADKSVRDLIVGEVISAFGVKGWLKIRSFTEPQENILAYQDWKLTGPNGSSNEVEVEASRVNKGLIVKVKGCSDRDKARSLVGSFVSIPADQLPDAGENEYYWFQLEDLAVVNHQGECLGEVSHLIETGSNDVMVVRPTAGSLDERERMVPYLPGKTVLDVQLDKKRILVDWDAGY